MLAEAIHSVADAGNQGLLLLGGKRPQKARRDEHPFGYGRERYIYSFIVAIVLFSVGGLFALYEAYHKFHEIHAGQGTRTTRSGQPLVVGAAGRAARRDRAGGLSFRTAIGETNKIKGDGVVRRSSSGAPSSPSSR